MVSAIADAAGYLLVVVGYVAFMLWVGRRAKVNSIASVILTASILTAHLSMMATTMPQFQSEGILNLLGVLITLAVVVATAVVVNLWLRHDPMSDLGTGAWLFWLGMSTPIDRGDMAVSTPLLMALHVALVVIGVGAEIVFIIACLYFLATKRYRRVLLSEGTTTRQDITPP
jgi:hypothetical protein